MPSLNRFQTVAVIASVVLLLGIFRAIQIFASLSRGGGQELTFASQRTLALPAAEKETFVKIGKAASRDPFAVPSRWTEPEPEAIDLPPLGDLLGLQPTPLLLRQDALPRIGPPPTAREERPDRELLTRVRRVFPQGVKETAAPKAGAAATPGAAAEPPKEVETPKENEPPSEAEPPKEAAPPKAGEETAQ